ncbi:MAG: DUF1800 domain-containing protein [Cocleimonas sp.]|nr:DUF1800 domain-containing protein [Cocleimonas sp.]
MHRLNLSDTRHLVSRTALGQEWAGVKALEGKTRAEAVSILLHSGKVHTPGIPATAHWSKLDRMRSNNGYGKHNALMQMNRDNKSMKAWMVKHLLSTRTPVNERMTLFWSNHFTSSLDGVEHPRLIYKQNKFLRDNAMGSFAGMLKGIIKDPAMLVYLDANKNIKGKVNENFARELLELFTLGRGHAYKEADIRAAASAFTGWGADLHRGTFKFDASKHENKPVTFLGVRNITNGNQIVDVLLNHHRTAEFIAEKVWREFISDNYHDRRYTQRWAKVFRSSNYSIKVLMLEVLNSDAFWDARYRGNMIKSPIDLVIGTLRILPFAKLPYDDLAHTLELLGQDPLNPPTVKGWAGGKNWINTQTMLVRTSFLNKITRYSGSTNAHLSRRLPKTTGMNVVNWLSPVTPVLPLPTTPGKLRLVRALVLDPTYQLK